MKKISQADLIQKLKSSIRYENVFEDKDYLSLEIDRYRRHDHGGGEDGDDWLEDHEIDEDFEQGKREHSSKLIQVNQILKDAGYEENAVFSLGEKGHFGIDINFRKKKKS